MCYLQYKKASVVCVVRFNSDAASDLFRCVCKQAINGGRFRQSRSGNISKFMFRPLTMGSVQLSGKPRMGSTKYTALRS